MLHRGGKGGGADPPRRDSGVRAVDRVLLFEGQPATLAVLVEILSAEGYLVDTAASWAEFSRKLAQLVPTAIVVDLDVVRPIQVAESPHQGYVDFPFTDVPPIIGIGDRIQAIGLDLAALIPKPIATAALLDSLAQLIAVSRGLLRNGQSRQ